MFDILTHLCLKPQKKKTKILIIHRYAHPCLHTYTHTHTRITNYGDGYAIPLVFLFLFLKMRGGSALLLCEHIVLMSKRRLSLKKRKTSGSSNSLVCLFWYTVVSGFKLSEKFGRNSMRETEGDRKSHGNLMKPNDS